jgi:hypothetical protein
MKVAASERTPSHTYNQIITDHHHESILQYKRNNKDISRNKSLRYLVTAIDGHLLRSIVAEATFALVVAGSGLLELVTNARYFTKNNIRQPMKTSRVRYCNDIGYDDWLPAALRVDRRAEKSRVSASPCLNRHSSPNSQEPSSRKL